MDIRKLAEEQESYVIAMRRWAHQHPEIAWEEWETTAFIEEELKKMGLEPKRFDDKHTGLYAMIYGGKAGPNAKTIMMRADIDALLQKEESGVPFASLYDGKFHCCGHDTHIGMLLGAAKILADMKDELQGNVKLLFQAAEETAIGAKYYLEQGVLDDVDAVYGCHTVSMVNAPLISVEAGPRTASSDEFKIKVTGKACHGGMPQDGKDAIVAAAAIISNLQTIASRGIAPIEPLVVTIGKIAGGTAYNIVSGEVEMEGCVRTYSKQLRSEMADRMDEIIQNTAKAFGCTAKLDYMWKTAPIVHDNEMMNRIAHDAVVKLYGEEGLTTLAPIGGSDDFAFYAERRPAIWAWIGGRNEATGCDWPQHSNHYKLDESGLVRGTALYVQFAIDYLAETNQ